MNIAEVIVDTLRRAGVQRVWGLPGDSLNAFTDALRRDGGLEWMHVRHEEAAAFAAAGEAALTGRLAVVAGSCGPGSLHFLNGLYDAQRSRVPVLVIASHIPSAEIGSGYFQQLRVPVVRRQRPAVVEHDRLGVLGAPVLEVDLRAVFGGDESHDRTSRVVFRAVLGGGGRLLALGVSGRARSR